MNNSDAIGYSGGIYQARFKDATGSWSPWVGLGGGLKSESVEVRLVQESGDATWRALTEFLLSTDDPMILLRLWNEGSFDEIRKEWPDAPEEIFPRNS